MSTVDIETKTKKNKEGELINPTREDIKKFNEKYDTYSPKKKSIVSKVKQMTSDGYMMVNKATKKVKSAIGKALISDTDRRTMKMMSDNGMVEGIMGANNYNSAFRQIKGRLDNKDEAGAQGYIQEQVKKIKGK